MSREVQILNELRKLNKAILIPSIEGIKKTKKRAKKIKLKDLFKADNLNIRINNWLDNLTLDDAINLSAFLMGIYFIYQIVWKMKPKSWWGERLLKKEPIWSPYHWTTRIFIMLGEQATGEGEVMGLDLNCLAISILTAYAVIYRGETIVDYSKKLVQALSLAM